MSRKSLLSIVQMGLTVTGGDAVSSISENQESEDMAMVARDVYYDVTSWDEWPHKNRIATVSVPGDITAPTVVRLRDSFSFIHKVQYLHNENGEDTGFTDLCYIEPEYFLDMCDSKIRNTDTVRMTGYGVNPSTFITVGTDEHPKFYTTFDNEHLIFDSYDKTVDPFISNYKTRVMASVIPDFQLDDSFILDIPDSMLELYLSQVRVAAYYYINQVNNPLDGNKSLRHLSKLRQYKSRIVNDTDEHYPQGVYGRRSNPTNHTKLGRR